MGNSDSNKAGEMRPITRKEALKKAVLVYGLLGSLMVSAAIMLLTHNLTAYNAYLRGIPYPIGTVLLAFCEFAMVFFIPFTIGGYFRVRHETVTEKAAKNTAAA